MARSSLPKHLLSLRLNSDKIFTTNLKESITQKEEIKLRKKVAEETNIKNYFKKIEKSHSIPVMDYEVNKFIQNIPQNGNILDVGGCWGWHWRNIDKIRPDIKVTIIDLISVNLKIASETLEDKINKNIFLVNGDATNMPFPKESFDAVWTVQALQHIYHFQKAIEEIYRVIKYKGIFINYSLNRQPHINLIKRILAKEYKDKIYLRSGMWLERASKRQKKIINNIFKSNIEENFTEIIFSPEFKFTWPGEKNNFIGLIDARLSNNFGLFAWLARQKSYKCCKNY